MNQRSAGSSLGMMIGCVLVLEACAVQDNPERGDDTTSTAVSAVLVQSCPGYGSCASWSSWETVGSPFCRSSTQCGDVCIPKQNGPDYCATQIFHTPECCDFVSEGETATTMQRYQWCWNLAGAMCEQIDQVQSFVSCGC